MCYYVVIFATKIVFFFCFKLQCFSILWCPNILSVLTPSEDSLTPIEHSLADLSVLTNSICPQNGVSAFVQVAPPWTSVAFFFVDGKMLPPLEYAVLEFHAIIRLGIILLLMRRMRTWNI